MTHRRPYDDRDYRAARKYLQANVVRCGWPGCSARATSPDHVPALAEHDHVRGSGCCALRPLCLSHNASLGARLTNRRRRDRTRGSAGLVPGSGWARTTTMTARGHRRDDDELDDD